VTIQQPTASGSSPPEQQQQQHPAHRFQSHRPAPLYSIPRYAGPVPGGTPPSDLADAVHHVYNDPRYADGDALLLRGLLCLAEGLEHRLSSAVNENNRLAELQEEQEQEEADAEADAMQDDVVYHFQEAAEQQEHEGESYDEGTVWMDVHAPGTGASPDNVGYTATTDNDETAGAEYTYTFNSYGGYSAAPSASKQPSSGAGAGAVAIASVPRPRRDTPRYSAACTGAAPSWDVLTGTEEESSSSAESAAAVVHHPQDHVMGDSEVASSPSESNVEAMDAGEEEEEEDEDEEGEEAPSDAATAGTDGAHPMDITAGYCTTNNPNAADGCEPEDMDTLFDELEELSADPQAEAAALDYAAKRASLAVPVLAGGGGTSAKLSPQHLQLAHQLVLLLRHAVRAYPPLQ
jgi:hypothetical protein